MDGESHDGFLTSNGRRIKLLGQTEMIVLVETAQDVPARNTAEAASANPVLRIANC